MACGQRGWNRQPRGGCQQARRGAAAPQGGHVGAVGVGRRAEQQLGVRVLRLVGDQVRRPGLDDLAGVHHRDRVREIPGRRDVVGDVEDREPLGVAQVGQQVEDAEPDRHIQHRDRLVGQQHARPHREGAGDRDTLPLAPGQLVRVLADELIRGGERHPFEQADDRLVQADARGGQPVHPQRPREVIPHVVHGVERGERVLQHHLHLARVAPAAVVAGRDRAAAEQQLAGGRLDQPGQQPGQRRLARSALADHGGDLRLGQRERDVLDRVHHDGPGLAAAPVWPPPPGEAAASRSPAGRAVHGEVLGEVARLQQRRPRCGRLTGYSQLRHGPLLIFGAAARSAPGAGTASSAGAATVRPAASRRRAGRRPRPAAAVRARPCGTGPGHRCSAGGRHSRRAAAAGRAVSRGCR